MRALLVCFGASQRRFFSLCRRRLRLNRSPGAKNLCGHASKNLKMFNHRLLFLFLFLSIFAPLASADPLSPADLKSLLGRIREKRAAAPQVQADFQEE